MARRLADTPGHRRHAHRGRVRRPPDRSARGELLRRPRRARRVFPGAFVRGRGLGGSSAVNGMIATPGDLRSTSRGDGPTPTLRSTGCSCRGSRPAEDELGPLDRALLAAAPDARSRPSPGAAGRRVTAADAYLARRPPDLRIMADRRSSTVQLDGRRATGVVLADGTTIDGDAVVRRRRRDRFPRAARPLRRRRSPASGTGCATIRRCRSPSRSPPASTSTGTVSSPPRLLRRGDIQVVPLNHLGPGTDGLAMLLVVLMTPTGRGRVRPTTASRSSRSRSATTTAGGWTTGSTSPGSCSRTPRSGRSSPTSRSASRRPASSTPRPPARWVGSSTTTARWSGTTTSTSSTPRCSRRSRRPTRTCRR